MSSGEGKGPVQSRSLLVGEITGVFGVQGELKLRSHTEPPAAISKYLPWQLTLRGELRLVERAACRMHGKTVLLKLPEVTDRTAAEALIGAEIRVDRERLPPLPPGQFYWADLEGLPVRTTHGVALGTVSHLFSTGANDVIVVQGERERLIPYVTPDFVISVDLAGGGIVVDWDPDF